MGEWYSLSTDIYGAIYIAEILRVEREYRTFDTIP